MRLDIVLLSSSSSWKHSQCMFLRFRVKGDLFSRQMYHGFSTSALTVSSYLTHSCCGSSTASLAAALDPEADTNLDQDLGMWVPLQCHNPSIMTSQPSWREKTKTIQALRFQLQLN